MSAEDHTYHREREQQCRALAQAASDPDVRRRHEELANLHASQAAEFNPAATVPAGARASAA